MPKASASATREDSISFNKNAQNLKRNQACHQCRKRKLKCDAKRPCSTCVRSHAYAKAHASPNDQLSLPEEPECTFDDVVNAPAVQPPSVAPKSRYERLENRINELESILRDKASSASESPPANSAQASPSQHSDSSFLAFGQDLSALPVSSFASQNEANSLSDSLDSVESWSKAYLAQQGQDSDINAIEFHGFTSSLDHLAGIASLMIPSPSVAQGGISTSSSFHDHIAAASDTPGMDGVLTTAHPSSNEVHAMMYMAWPVNLPDVAMTRHLVQAFFSHHIHARRMFHVSSFLASLDLHPTDPKFPCTSTLHVMCAIGIDSTLGARLKKKRRHTSFSDKQAAFAKEEVLDELGMGERIFENAQTLILLTWFYQSNARWIEACLHNSMAIKTTISCALNVCPPFHGISATDPFSDRPSTILPSSRNVLEDETRRNTFWIAYILERQIAAGNGWAMLADDRDVAQLLPIRDDQFNQGLLVLPADRQWSHSKDILSVHPPDQTDSFILHVKCSLLFSKVKNFNIRFKSLAFAGDASVTPPVEPTGQDSYSQQNQFPVQFRNPIAAGKIDHYLYSSWNLVHITQIQLHEPYSRPGKQSCTSALKILTASRSIVDLLHAISSSSFDVSLLDISAFLSWFMAGRVLVRFLKAAQDAQAQDQILSLKTEIAFLRVKLVEAGARIPLAANYAKMLSNIFVSTCGEDEEYRQHGVTYAPQVDHMAQSFEFSYPTPPDLQPLAQ
ncbi:hypothetical protein BC835DRAFT_108286 [Cytidiella melzeri]|nr:hypothetical protein BC835DRAFT_108286 [Cytidiella melzeri]